MAPEHHAPNLVGVVHVRRVFQHAVDPAGYRNTGNIHQALVITIGILDRGKPAFQIVKIGIPDPGPVTPGAVGQAIIARQCVRQHAQIGRTLHVVMPAENIGAAAGFTHIPQSQLQHAVGAGVVIAVGMLGTTHAPDHGAWPVLCHHPGNPAQLRTRHAGDIFHFLRVPFRHFGANLVHAPNALANEFLVFPAIFENVPQNAPNQSHICARTEPDIFISMRSGPGEPRVADDQGRVVLLLRPQHMQQGNRVRLGRVAADDEDGP